MNEIQVTVSTILALFGALAVVAGGVKVIMQMCSPFKRIAQRITECEKRLDNHDCEKCRICFNAYFCSLDDKTDVYVIWVFFFGHQGKNLLW